ncbi:hypothetical protein Tco_0257125 [Tanacetum coccineum]
MEQPQSSDTQQNTSADQLVRSSKFQEVERCNNYAVLPNIPCPRECRFVGKLLVDHARSYALTTTTNIPAIVGYQGLVDKVSAFYTKNLAQPWQTMFKVFNRYPTSRTSTHDQTKINILQIFHVVVNKLHVNHVSLLWWDFIHCVQQKKNVIQYPRFTKLIIADIMEKFELVPKRLEKDY